MGNKKLLRIYTDGACTGNPGPGGWAAVNCTEPRVLKIICGFEENTTNNRMELLAVIKALSIWQRCDTIEIYSDSKYVIDCFKRWRDKWNVMDKSTVKNLDLWEEMFAIALNRDIQFTHVRGHSGHLYNEIADSVATKISKTGGLKE